MEGLGEDSGGGEKRIAGDWAVAMPPRGVSTGVPAPIVYGRQLELEADLCS